MTMFLGLEEIIRSVIRDAGPIEDITGKDQSCQDDERFQRVMEALFGVTRKPAGRPVKYRDQLLYQIGQEVNNSSSQKAAIEKIALTLFSDPKDNRYITACNGLKAAFKDPKYRDKNLIKENLEKPVKKTQEISRETIALLTCNSNEELQKFRETIQPFGWQI